STAKSKKDGKAAWQVAPNLLTSFRYAWAGILYATRTQRNFRIHLVIGLIALSLGIILHISALEAAVVAITISAVLVMELMNTALESVVDLTVGQTYHELAKIAKDCAAGAVLIAAMAALLVAGFIYLPPFVSLLGSGIA
ncbi:MAG: diacylglycerol kinase family protein, partial [Cyanobacteria bacterium J06642_11]